jgi:hypothetical protein
MGDIFQQAPSAKVVADDYSVGTTTTITGKSVPYVYEN